MKPLFRPVGLRELELIAASGWQRFPPRLPEQPIFYPVLTLQYAIQIARDWNATSDEQAGFVTRFEVDEPWCERYDEHVVGAAAVHRELWVPADELDDFNAHLVGPIEVVEAFFGSGFDTAMSPAVMEKLAECGLAVW
jgi:hypothetical protein